ncbi:MAG TPA: hypothetical protein VJG30_03550 [Candidatus Nanoarchaeia archaeon]|nr:hypothetical protein [Candidatus Nanoarchaeia archaeon]
MKKSTTLLFLILAVLIVACTQSDKQQAEALQVETINAITNADATKTASVFSKDYIDFSQRKRDLNEEYFKQVFENEFYKTSIQGRAMNELFDVDKKEVFNFKEISNSKYKDIGKETEFEFKEWDILINYPPKEGSGIQEGFLAVYRKENGKWMIVAGE